MLMPGAPLQTLTPVSTPGSPSDLAGLTQKDTTFTKIFVGGLPYHTTDQSLRSHFEVYGEIEEAVVITDRQTGKSRGYGFVTMSDRLAAERACKDPNPIIDGRKANVNLAYLGAKPRGNVATSFPLTGLRAGFPALLPGQFGLTPQLVYQSPFMTPQNVMPLPGASQNAISQATMAALASQFYDPAVAAATAYAAQFANMDQLAYSNAAGAAAGLMGPTFTYTSALPTTAASMQGVATNPLHLAYASQAALQEARMQ